MHLGELRKLVQDASFPIVMKGKKKSSSTENLPGHRSFILSLLVFDHLVDKRKVIRKKMIFANELSWC